jgi:hypothetical protein
MSSGLPRSYASLLQPHYRPSSLVRAGPPRELALASLRLYIDRIRILNIGFSPHGFRHLCFSLKRTFAVSGKRSLSHPSPGSRSSAQEPGPGTRPLYDGCRAPSNQVFGALIPEGFAAPGSGGALVYRRVIEGFACATAHLYWVCLAKKGASILCCELRNHRLNERHSRSRRFV